MTVTKKARRALQLMLLSCMSFYGNAWAAKLPELDCVIEPHMVIDLSSRTDGIVESIEVDRGDFVEAGQVVVRLESGVEQAAVEYARAAANADSDLEASKISMDFAHRRRGRLESLYKEKVLSSDQMDEMETEAVLTKLERDQAKERRRLARLELRQALEVLERHTIPSPIDGVVVQRFLAPGESVEEKPIIRLAQINPLRVEVIVPVSYFGSIQPGQPALIMPERPMQGEYRAQVTVVDRVADAASGTYRVRLSLPNPDYKLPSGLKCMVRFLPMSAAVPATMASDARTQTPRSKQAALTAGAAPQAATAATRATARPGPGSNGPIAIAHAGLSSGQASRATSKPDKTTVTNSGSIARSAAPDTSVANETVEKSAPKTLTACRTIGPLDDEGRVAAVKAALQGHVGQLLVRQQVDSKKNGFVIVSNNQGSVAKAKVLAEKMRAAGVDDLFVFGRGPHKGRVSLGLYKGPKMAEERVREVQAAGFAAQAIPRESKTTRYFVDVEVGGQAQDAGLPADARKLLAENNAVPTDCKRLIAARQ